MMCDELEHLGIKLDDEKNRTSMPQIQAQSSAIALLVIPTDEEYQIALYVQQRICKLNY